MSYLYKMPDVGEGIAEGTILQWFVKEGDEIKENERLLEIQNDKLVQEVDSPHSGKITKLFAQAGDVVRVGENLAEFDGDGSASAAPAAPAAEPAAPVAAPAASAPAAPAPTVAAAASTSETPVPAPTAPVAAPAVAAPEAVAAAAQAYPDNSIDGRILAMPSIRAYAREKQVDLTVVRATGKHGHIRKEDVDAYIAGGGAAASAVSAAVAAGGDVASAAAKPAPVTSPVTPQGIPVGAAEYREAMSPIRKIISKAMVASKAHAPHVTLFGEVEVSALIAHRSRYKELAQANDIKLTYLAYITKALVLVAKKFPVLNASVDETTEEIVYKQSYNVGIAVDTSRGLFVPNVKRADTKGVMAIAKEIATLAAASQDGTLAGEDMREGTITITNIGSFQGTWFTPIINYPEAAILGVGTIEKKPVVNEEGEIAVGSMMALSLSFDHRIIDGATAQKAMNELKRLLHDPALLLMEG